MEKQQKYKWIRQLKWYEYLLIAYIFLFNIPYSIYLFLNGNRVDIYPGYLIQAIICLFLLWLSYREKRRR